MTLMSPAPVDVATRQRRLDALKIDLGRTLKQCGPSILTPHPTHGARVFVIASEDIDLPRDTCSRRGTVQRSALKESINESELVDLISELRAGKYHIKTYEKAANGSWISYRIEYFAGDEWS